MKSLKNLTGDSLEQLIDYNVVDQNGDEIGTLHSLWSDPDTGAVEFLGVKTGWLFGQNHVVPAGKAELDEAANVVRLPYTEDFIKEAPAISADAEISEEEETNIYQYYGTTRAGVLASSTAAGDTGAVAGTPLPEVAGGSSLASGSAVDEGAGGYAAPATSVPTGVGLGTAGSANRWRRTSRPGDADTSAMGTMGGAGSSSTTFGDPTTAPGAGDAVRAALDDLSPADTSGNTTPMTPASPGSYGTANLYGSTGSGTPVSADSLGRPMATGTSTSTTGAADSEMTSPGASKDVEAPVTREAGDENRDPITGEPGSHPVGTGVGAFSGGATGAAIGGAIGGPIGAPVGAVLGGIVGAVGGGLAGKGVAESINPTEEDAYWQANHRGTSYFENDYEYSDYAPAYKTGYQGYGRHVESGRDYDEVEPELKQDYERAKGGSRLEWEKAKSATRDAWERLKAKASSAAK